MSRYVCALVLVAVGLLVVPAGAGAQTDSRGVGSIEGTVSTQNGAVALPGVLVSVRDASDREVGQQVSDGDGHFAITALMPARYHVRASLDGFETLDREALVAGGATARLTLDLAISTVNEHVEVVAKSPAFEAPTLATTEAVAASEVQVISPGQGVPGALRLMTGVIEVPGGDSIDGGRPYQAGMQVGAATLIDPATNLSRIPLPAGALDSVSVLPNPYEVEFGRFSSGLVQVQTRRAADKWSFGFSTLEPALRLKRYTVANVTGITIWQPDIEVSGPIVKGRLFLRESAQYHYQTIDIPSRPETELKKVEWFSSLTRLDANLSPRHTLVVSGGFAPNLTTQELLGTFVPPNATVNVDDDASHALITERALLGKGTAIETTFEFHQYDTGVTPQGFSPMQLLPETTLGNFYNRQRRTTGAYQWIETASHSYKGLGGIHLLKAGLDVLHSGFDGTSESGPVLIDRSNGTLARRLDFAGPSVESVHATDVAAFAQDRFQPVSRLSIDIGLRFDYDGITGEASGTPRVGVAWRFDDAGRASIHGGYGLFYERTPSVAGAFDQFESPIDTRFAEDGVTPLGPPVLYRHVTSPNLEPAHSGTWDVGFDQRVSHGFSYHAGVLERSGQDQLIVEPTVSSAGAEYLLSSTGRSNYLQEEVLVHLAHGTRADLNASYVHSSAREDLNSLLNFYDVVPQPIIGVNEYADAFADARHRVLFRGHVMPTGGWLLVGTVDWRSGLPYSDTDENLEFVGPRNAHRFPNYFRVDAGFERRLTVKKFHPWLGLRVSNALNSFLPADVQSNLESPAYGSFYNSVYREYRIRVRFEK